MNEDVPSTSSIGLTVSETTEEMSLEYKVSSIILLSNPINLIIKII